MRRPSIHDRSRDAMELNMTPMIDVIFQLLIFFIWTAGFQTVEYLLPSQLTAVTGSAPAVPNQPPPAESDFDLVIRVIWTDTGAAWQLNEQPLDDLTELRAKLTDLARIQSGATVILHPDPEVPLGDVIDVYDLSRLAGFTKVQFATSLW